MANQDPSNLPPQQTNLQGSTNARPATRNEVAYRNGYVQGQNAKDRNLAAEERLAHERARYDLQASRDNENAARGLLLGIFVMALLGLVGGALFLFNQREENNLPTIIPVPQNNQPQNQAAPPSPKQETTIIERTIDRTQEVIPVPAPQPQQPAEQPAPQAPNIDINIPNPVQQSGGEAQQPAEAPAPANEAPAAEQQSAPESPSSPAPATAPEPAPAN